MVDAGIIVLASFIFPFRAGRQLARDLHDDGEFIEVHVDAPLEVAEARDGKGLHARARRGELMHFTGIDSPYEPPESPELRLDAGGGGVRRCVGRRGLRVPRRAGVLTPPTEA
ncbi:MAG TPA: adenylyl-sulfate kinase [Amycolatopsis sp.]|uniref:adenylyl-sulfate kinase n=1 Tax=Amycolatopsis sp. TaxID=37632 RepID=UPI002B4A1347|nr:adenylyl-sulfate kinase [Amycolatopsis sp.]HKS43633.1 adenylyl-sulfate kinase [Amycolatopsis sp.]